MSLQLAFASTMRSWELTFLCDSATVAFWKDDALCMLWRLMLPHKVHRYFTGRECSNMVRLAKWRNQLTVQSSWWMNNQQFAAMYHFHSVPIPLTWLNKKIVSSSRATITGSCSDSVSDTHNASQALIQVYFFRKVCLLPRTNFKVHTGSKLATLGWPPHSSDLALWFHSLICDRIAAQNKSCVKVFEMTSPEIDKRSKKRGLKKHTFFVLGAVFTECSHCNCDIIWQM